MKLFLFLLVWWFCFSEKIFLNLSTLYPLTKRSVLYKNIKNIGLSLFVMAMISDPLFADTYQLPFAPSVRDGFEGFVRIVNVGSVAATVSAQGLDDDGEFSLKASFSIPAYGAKAFKVADLEVGNVAKGLSGAIGIGAGSWRLYFTSDELINVFSYYRNSTTGFLNPLHDTVHPSRLGSYHVLSGVNPGKNTKQVSYVRLMNNSTKDVTVTITGRDELGALSGTATVNLDPLEAKLLTSLFLENEGLGAGQGKWELRVSSNRAIGVMGLLLTPGEYLSNLSANPDTRTDMGGRFTLACSDLDGVKIFSSNEPSTYLGHLGSDSATYSISNPTGVFGPSSANGVLNALSDFGSPTGSGSAYNPNSTTPPVLIKNGRVLSHITNNTDSSLTLYPNADLDIILSRCVFTAAKAKNFTDRRDAGIHTSLKVP